MVNIFGRIYIYGGYMLVALRCIHTVLRTYKDVPPSGMAMPAGGTSSSHAGPTNELKQCSPCHD